MATAAGGKDGTSSFNAESQSAHSVDQAALVWQHIRQKSGQNDEAESLYDETGMMGPPWM